jgi:CubicO group peptidase (beta-lactamase class C family)
MRQSLQRPTRFVVLLLLLAALIGRAPGMALAQEDSPDFRDAAGLAAFVDGVMAAFLETESVAGGTVSIVADGEILLSKGYGYAHVTAHQPVIPDETLFRIGSVSKLFVWTAVMQLVEAGRMDLHADINTYLGDVRVADTFDEPITMAHLMSHTPGFEDRALGLFARESQDLPTLAEALRVNVPERVQPPGRFSVYSNYGTALAAYAVEQVTGVPFYQYVEQSILAPLGMERTTLRQPIPDHLAGGLAPGYIYRQGEFTEGNPEYIPLYPAGAAISTAEDMARFMLAHLQGGELDGERILGRDTVAQMGQQLFTHHPELPGMAHGWMMREINGMAALQHGGNTLLFHSLLLILPAEEVGIFVSFNGEGAALLPAHFATVLMDHYFPASRPSLAPPGDFAERATRFTGSYRVNRISYTNFEKSAALAQSISVAATPDGYLLINGPMGPDRYVEVASLTFAQVNGGDKVVFWEDGNGAITHFFYADFPVIGLEKLAWHETPALHLSLIGIGLLLFLGTLIGWGIVGVRGLGRGGRSALGTAARWAAALMGLAALVFVVGFASLLADVNQAAYGLSPLFDLLLWLPRIMALLAAISLALAVMVWARRTWGLWSRLHYSLVVLFGLTLTWVMAYWNLLTGA